MANINSISTFRLTHYKKIFNCATDVEALKYYYWNQAISAEIYILLHNIEICLRNRIHEVLSNDASLQQSLNFAWFDRLYLMKPDPQNPQKVIDTVLGSAIKKVKRDLGQKNKPPHPHNIICNLEFGKWKYVLLTKTYKDPRGRSGNAIDWNTLFPLIFPQFMNHGRKSSQKILDRLTEISKLRNRVAHLEPVWKFEAKVFNKTVIPAPKDEVTALDRLGKEINWAIVFLSWICQDSYDHYINTNSFKRLQNLITKAGLDSLVL